MFGRIVFGILVAAVLLFVAQNTQVVEVNFLIWRVEMSRALVILTTLLIGILGGWLAKRPKAKEKRKK